MGKHTAARWCLLRQTTMRLVTSTGHDVDIATSLRYCRRDPFAVHMRFDQAGTAPVSWTFGRDLLIGALAMPSGIGDVRIFRRGNTLEIDLDSPDGCARLRANLGTMIDFITEMTRLVPVGSESQHLDIDGALAAFTYTR